MNVKTFFCYLTTDCGVDGVWIKDLELASLFVGCEITESEIDLLINKGALIDLGAGKYFIPSFISSQYPKGLSSNNAAHKNVILSLKSCGLLNEDLSIKELIAQTDCEPEKKAETKQKGIEIIPKIKETKTKKTKITIEQKQTDLEKRMLEFKATLKPYEGKYEPEMLEEFYNYWSAPNKSGTKFMREQHEFWNLSGRLATWAKNYKPKLKPQQKEGYLSQLAKATNNEHRISQNENNTKG